MLFSVFGEEYVVFCTFKKSCAGWLVMQGISLHRVSSQTISKGGGKGKQQKKVLKNMLGWLADSESSFLMKRKH